MLDGGLEGGKGATDRGVWDGLRRRLGEGGFCAIWGLASGRVGARILRLWLSCIACEYVVTIRYRRTYEMTACKAGEKCFLAYSKGKLESTGPR
jgi:hypothetical protein